MLRFFKVEKLTRKNMFLHLQIRYTGFRDRPQEERMLRFQSACRTEGRTEIAFVASGTNLQLTFNCNMMPYGHERECDFEKEQGKVSTNGVKI